jgi:hypothetical protein
MARLASTVQPGRFDAAAFPVHGSGAVHAAEPTAPEAEATPPATLLTEPAVVPPTH